MFDATYPLALAAGMLATVNPCGFALLPAYLSLLVSGEDGTEGRSGRLSAINRALVLSAAMTVGFVLVFGAFGMLAAPVADVVARNAPWVSLVIGLALAMLGAWLLAGKELPYVGTTWLRGPAATSRFWSMVAFGASYAIASLGCTIAPFLALVATSFRSGSTPAGVALFASYAAGMALVVSTAALAVALARTSFVRLLRRAAPLVPRLGGVLLVLSGLYVAWYAGFELRVFRDPDATDAIIDRAAVVQTALSGWLRDLGPTAAVMAFGVVLAASLSVAVLLGLRRAGR